MIETLRPLFPDKLFPSFGGKWEAPKTLLETWFSIAETHFNEPWAFYISEERNLCVPRVIKFAYKCRWEPIDSIISYHKKFGRVIIDGHFCYLVRKDLAIQSRSFPVDRGLLLSLIEDNELNVAFNKGKYNSFIGYLAVYFCLGHRGFFEKMYPNLWKKFGIPNKEYEKLKDDDGKLNMKKYEKKVLQPKYKKTIEHTLISKYKHSFLDILKLNDNEQCEYIQPNFIF
ncbi:MAG: hypothetical protein JSW28_02770, partial [Thermoplasmata archaeon]